VGVDCAFFFFQAEDGIRDFHVTGVQTCALPISEEMRRDDDPEIRSMAEEEIRAVQAQLAEQERKLQVLLLPSDPNDERNIFLEEIGRASCRERVEIWRAAVAGERKKRRGESGGK